MLVRGGGCARGVHLQGTDVLLGQEALQPLLRRTEVPGQARSLVHGVEGADVEQRGVVGSKVGAEATAPGLVGSCRARSLRKRARVAKRRDVTLAHLRRSRRRRRGKRCERA